MKNRNLMGNNKKTLIGTVLISALLSVFASACSSSYERGEKLSAGDEMKSGPGIFSGDKGGFYLVGGEEKVADEKPVSKMNLSETSKVLDQKIEQLKQDQLELEALKRALNKKLDQ